MFDAAHPAGLIAGGAHPSPVGVADVVTLTTHKTLRGPRGGAILCGEELAKKIDSAVFPGLQGGPLEHVIAAKAVAFAEAARPEFRQYAEAGRGQRGRPGRAPWPGTGSGSSRAARTTTCCWSTCSPFDPELTGKEAQEVLDRAGITCNRNTIPDDPRSPFLTSGLRLGTAAETTAGMGTGRNAAGGRPHRAHAQGPDRRGGDRRGARRRSPCSAPPSRRIPISWPNACPTSAGTAWSW